jgi:hypothetical protein
MSAGCRRFDVVVVPERMNDETAQPREAPDRLELVRENERAASGHPRVNTGPGTSLSERTLTSALSVHRAAA